MFGQMIDKWGWVRLTENPVHLGARAELFVTDWLASVLPGCWQVKHVGTGGGHDVELVHLGTGEIKRVEVKISRRCVSDGKYRATLETATTSAEKHADIVVFICVPPVGDAVPFVIPMARLRGRRGLCVTSNPATYTGKFSPYRHNLGAFDVN